MNLITITIILKIIVTSFENFENLNSNYFNNNHNTRNSNTRNYNSRDYNTRNYDNRNSNNRNYDSRNSNKRNYDNRYYNEHYSNSWNNCRLLNKVKNIFNTIINKKINIGMVIIINVLFYVLLEIGFYSAVKRYIKSIFNNENIINFIIAINVIVYLVWAYAYYKEKVYHNNKLLKFMINNFTTSWTNSVMKKRYWTFFTDSFSQENFIHLINNMNVLNSIGLPVSYLICSIIICIFYINISILLTHIIIIIYYYYYILLILLLYYILYIIYLLLLKVIKKIGMINFILSYIFCGISSSVAHTLFYHYILPKLSSYYNRPNFFKFLFPKPTGCSYDNISSLGASGAITGIDIILLCKNSTNWISIIYYLLIDNFYSMIIMYNIDVIGHIGGGNYKN